MAKVVKPKICVSINKDIYLDLEKYSKDREISLSTATERILIEGFKNINNNQNFIQQLQNILSIQNSEEVKKEVKENKIDRNKLNEDDKALFDIFDSIPD